MQVECSANNFNVSRKVHCTQPNAVNRLLVSNLLKLVLSGDQKSSAKCAQTPQIILRPSLMQVSPIFLQSLLFSLASG